MTFLTLLLLGMAQDAPVIRSDVRQVLVPFVVNDQHGRHITGLKAADIEVFEDGKPQRIVSLRSESVGGAAQASAETNGASKVPEAPPVARHTYLIIVDTLHSSFASFGRVRDALGKFFEQEQMPGAQYALMSLGRGLDVVQDSTSDPAAVMTAARSRAFANMVRNSESDNVAKVMEEFSALIQKEYCGMCGGCNSSRERNLPGCSGVRARMQGMLTSFAERTLFENLEFLRHLEDLVKATASMPTSRTVIFISDGFNRFPGRELYAILREGYGVRDRNFQFNTRDTQPQLDAILKLATKYNVKFYTLDSRGLYSAGSIAGGGFSAATSLPTPPAVDSLARSLARENTDALSQLARETGGLFFENNNDLLKGMRQAVADRREYYILSYAPENNAADGSYRKIAVKVKNAKWQVTAKAGYWATGN